MALNPQTPLSAVEPCLDLCDLALVMSVPAGFGGQPFHPVALDKLRRLREIGGPELLLEVDGDIVATAAGAACMGHPADAVAMFANFLATRGEYIKAGWIIFSGGLTAAVPLNAGTSIRATYGHLGSVGVRGV